MFAFVVVLAWTAIPALACLPNATMTQAEMACCKTKVEQPTSVAVVDRTATHVHPFIVATLLDVALLPEPGLNRVGPSMSRDLPPPAPPGLSSVLRI